MRKLECFGCVLLCATAIFASASSAQTVLIEAEGFNEYGGWVLDQQFMDQMGSPYLLAHGLGEPVADAVTTATIPQAGRYKVWVRTYDWVAPWKTPETEPLKRAEGTPGRFQVIIDDAPLDTTFGVEGASWNWQDGGTVELDESEITLRLHDLTGFEGRCDAIVLTKDMSSSPPNVDPEMKSWRRQLLQISETPVEAGEFDLVVIGGGTGGMCAALKAARLGLSVALIQDRPVVGGNNSSEVRVWLNGETNYEPYPRVGDILREFEPAKRAHYGPSNTAELYEDQKRIGILESEENIKLFLRYRANKVEVDDGLITAVIAEHTKTGQHYRFKGRCFADCTGDGCIGFLAGADYEIHLDGHMGRCNLWNAKDAGQTVGFPQCLWALDLGGKPFPSELNQLGGWYWESGFYHDPFEKSEYIRDWNFRAMYGAWDALKNVKGRYQTYKLNWAAYISGKRESRRLLGDVILTEPNIVQQVEFEDNCVPCSWDIDLHLPDPRYDDGWEGDEFISKAYYTRYDAPYWIPYRCLYSRNINNLFMAGRDISVTHEALGAVRVMRTGGMMGEIVGMAASICKKHDVLPRAVYTDHLAELKKLMTQEILVGWLAHIGPNLTLDAEVGVSSNYDVQKYPQKHINDGRATISENTLRWLSSADSMPDHVTFHWEQPRSISAARIISGWHSSGKTSDPIIDFKFQYYDSGQWRDVEGSEVTNNTQIKWAGKFSAIKASHVRLVITRTPMNISRIWEVELFHPKADIDDDGMVNFADLAELALHWPVAGENLPGDLDASNSVDFKDFGILSVFWPWP